MYRSIPGLADAFQSMGDAKYSLRNSDRRAKLGLEQEQEQEAPVFDADSTKRLSDASQFFGDMESCTARISAKLREIDNMNLNMDYERSDDEEDDKDVIISNEKKFLNDQCYRAQLLLNGDFYMRSLHSQEVNKDIMQLDERTTYTSKNWRHALLEIGISEADLDEPKRPQTEATQSSSPSGNQTQTAPTSASTSDKLAMGASTSTSSKVRRNSVCVQTANTVVEAEADYSDYNAEELSELNQLLNEFMDATFLNGSNGHKLSGT
jgi:hypothetical protein